MRPFSMDARGRALAVSPLVVTAFSVTALTLLSLAAVPLAAEPAPMGFFEASVEAHLGAERAFLAGPRATEARASLKRLTEEPHVAGTPAELAVADYVLERFRDLGLDAELARYRVFLNHPETVSLALVEPEVMPLSLMEEFLPEDKDSSATGMFPGFHGYGASGEAKGQVVYANYGTAADFAQLESMGIKVEGKIVLARYGQVFRGLKVREAEKAGAIGVVLYSDPADDGYMRGDVYPDGPMRPPSAIQRGSVQYLSIQPGDPSTPGWPSRDGARRLARKDMKTVPQIPSLPIGYGEAEKILRNLGGDNVPGGWQGGLPFAYHLGPGGASVKMTVEMDEGLKPIANVIARIEGSAFPEQMIILGNHRDAWNHGAVDPNSGTAAMIETARGLAAALATGWRPKRTIVLASWDAEEYGLVGSVEWGEDQADALRSGAIAYINLDSAVTGGRLGVSGIPSLRDLAVEAAHAVEDPVRGGAIADDWLARMASDWAENTPIDLDGPDAEFEPEIGALGSGSDYTVFVDHLGLPALNFGFGGPYGVYHSMYDNFRWMERFGDPQFVYHVAAARYYGVLAMRLASADVLPMRFAPYARSLRHHLDALRRTAVRKARAVRIGKDGAASAPTFDFTPVLAALDRFADAASAADRRAARAVEMGDNAAARTLNEAFRQLESEFLVEDGLPNRPWFRHLLYAPGTTTGYAAWPFPELREGLELDDEAAFARGAERVAAALDRASRRLAE